MNDTISKTASIIALFAFAALSGQLALAGSYKLDYTFEIPTLENGAAFGTAVALDGGVAVFKSGSVYGETNNLVKTHVFEEVGDGTWTEAATLEYHEFSPMYPNGQGLAIDEGTIVMGHFAQGFGRYDSPRFAERHAEGWVERIQSGLHPAADPFARTGSRTAGRSVDISGRIAVASDVAASQNGLTQNPGATGVARIYEKTNDDRWLEVANLWDDSPNNEDFHVWSVSIDGDTIMAIDRGNTDESGLFVFDRSESGEWNLSHAFRNPRGGTNPWFLANVELDGDAAVVRKAGHEFVEIYERNNESEWVLSQELSSSMTFVLTGGTTAIENDLLAVTTHGEGDQANVVELYRRQDFGDWVLFDSIEAPESEPNFGRSLALSNRRLLVGTNLPSRFDADDPPGVAYLFVPVPEPSTVVLVLFFLLVAGTLCRSHRRS